MFTKSTLVNTDVQPPTFDLGPPLSSPALPQRYRVYEDGIRHAVGSGADNIMKHITLYECHFDRRCFSLAIPFTMPPLNASGDFTVSFLSKDQDHTYDLCLELLFNYTSTSSNTSALAPPSPPSFPASSSPNAASSPFTSSAAVAQHAPPPAQNATLYCPGNANDLNVEGGSPTFSSGGWTMTGDARVSSKASWNLLGGYMEWTMDTTRVHAEVNTNLYTVSPSKPNCGKDCYCDIQKNPSGKASCMELDLIEANGDCEMAATIHTFATDGKPNNGNCDRWGCAARKKLPSNGTFHMRADFGLDGSVTIAMNGNTLPAPQPTPSAASNAVVVSTMASIGASIESSQWFGWAPAESDCPKGDKSGLASSVVVISNVRVSGVVVQGPPPSLCR